MTRSSESAPFTKLHARISRGERRTGAVSGSSSAASGPAESHRLSTDNKTGAERTCDTDRTGTVSHFVRRTQHNQTEEFFFTHISPQQPSLERGGVFNYR